MTYTILELPKEKTLRELAARYPQANPEAIESMILLLRVTSDLSEVLESRLAKHDLSSGRFSLLMLLSRADKRGVSPSELAARAGVTRATITGFLDRLEKAGLAVREDDPNDRRGMFVKITAKGTQLIEKIMPGHCSCISKLMSRMTKADNKKFAGYLRKIKDGLDAFHEKEKG